MPDTEHALPEDLLERVGVLADMASNYSEYAIHVNAPMSSLPAELRADALGRGMTDIRDSLLQMLIDLGGEKPWWAEVQP